MAIATVYTCDISGYSSKNPNEFQKVQLTHVSASSSSWSSPTTKLWYIHEPVAQRLGLSLTGTVEPIKPPSTEDLLLELIRSIASEAAIEAVSNR